MSINNTEKSYSNRQSVYSDIGNLKLFKSESDWFEDSNENFQTETKNDSRIDMSQASLGNLITSSSFDNDEINRIETEESVSSIQELLFYVYENEGSDFYFKTNKCNDFMRTEIPRESFCDLNKRDKFKRKESSMKLFKAHCICPIASDTLENKKQDLENLKCCEQPNEYQKRMTKSPLFVFEVEPYSLLFLNCKPGKTYVIDVEGCISLLKRSFNRPMKCRGEMHSSSSY